MLAGFSVFADDLYVNSSGLEGTYYTIQEAVDAASDGDNIYISTVGVFGEDVTINKSLYLISSIPDEEWTMAGDITISDPGNKVEVTIIGLANGNISTSGTSSNGSEVNVISSTLSSFSSGNGWKGNVYHCVIENIINIDNGHIIANDINCYVSVGDDVSYAAMDTIKIIANHITNSNGNGIYYSNDEHYMELSNNYIYADYSGYYPINIQNFRNVAGGSNLITNNTLDASPAGWSSSSYRSISISDSGNGQNLIIANNVCENQIYSTYSMENAYVANNYYTYGITNFDNSLLYDNVYSSQISYTPTFSVTTGIVTGVSNTGLDWIEFRDIDNTVNDVGTGGGQHAWSNYHPAQGKAAIVDLELPHQLYIGGVHSVKAKAIHKN